MINFNITVDARDSQAIKFIFIWHLLIILAQPFHLLFLKQNYAPRHYRFLFNIEPRFQRNDWL